jgi:hypothetical protein
VGGGLRSSTSSRWRLDCIRDALATLTHPDERFMLDAPTPAYATHYLPASLGLIDHGYAFARPGDFHNNYETAGSFQRLRFGQRRFAPPHRPELDYSGVGSLSPGLSSHEQAALIRLRADLTGLLGVAELLPDDRADALRDRVERMHSTQEILREADF